MKAFFGYGAHGRSRTSDRLVRSQVLYPAELHARCGRHYATSFLDVNQLFQSFFILKNDGGEGGIRTLDTGLGYTPLAGERLQPLGHLTKFASGILPY